MMSPTLLDSYLNAAAEISRLAVGNADATASESQYRIPRWVSQTERVDGAPFGTRGGTSVLHNFPADGEYVFRVSFHHETTGTVVGNGRSALQTADALEQVEISIDGERVALLEMDRWMHVSDPNSVEMSTEPILVAGGAHRVTAAFIKRTDGPVQDLISPHDWSLAGGGSGGDGITTLPHLQDLIVGGPVAPKGLSNTPSRDKIFTCRPTSPPEEQPCARETIQRLASTAYRRPVGDDELDGMMRFYLSGSEAGGFEQGVRSALEAILASPFFVLRLEREPDGLAPGASYKLGDLDLASRLSFFLWGTPPDDELIRIAEAGNLNDVQVLDRQTRRMIADPRAEALGTRFATQWLRLQDLYKVHPDPNFFPNFDETLADAMRRETEMFFNHLVQENRDALELLYGQYTFVNERLATHYGMKGIAGSHFRQVAYTDDVRSGLLGHGSVLVLTSLANRTSPVLRGKWVMEVLLGTPPPPPPPGIPDLEETEGTQDGVRLTTRERMELHRANPTCNSCHRFMDPIGLALDNFDVTGQLRVRENGMRLDTRGEFYDGTPISTPKQVADALLQRPVPLMRNLTENLMAYAIARRVQYYDQPTIRAIVAEAEDDGEYGLADLIVGVVQSDAFRMKRTANSAVSEDARK